MRLNAWQRCFSPWVRGISDHINELGEALSWNGATVLGYVPGTVLANEGGTGKLVEFEVRADAKIGFGNGAVGVTEDTLTLIVLSILGKAWRGDRVMRRSGRCGHGDNSNVVTVESPVRLAADLDPGGSRKRCLEREHSHCCHSRHELLDITAQGRVMGCLLFVYAVAV